MRWPRPISTRESWEGESHVKEMLLAITDDSTRDHARAGVYVRACTFERPHACVLSSERNNYESIDCAPAIRQCRDRARPRALRCSQDEP
jgi:hypothetical protein